MNFIGLFQLFSTFLKISPFYRSHYALLRTLQVDTSVKMINLRNSPFLWLAIMLLISFRIGEKFAMTLSPWSIIPMAILCMMCSTVCVIRYLPRRQFISTIGIASLIFFAGILRFQHFNKELFPDAPPKATFFVHGIVEVDQVLKNKNTSVTIKCRTIFIAADRDTIDLPLQDKYLLVMIQSTDITNFFPGDILMVKGRISSIPHPLNPYSFDAKEYYKTMGIRQQLSCKGKDVLRDSISEKSFSRFTAQWQSFLSTLVKNNVSPQVAQLTNALVWGDRSDMDNDVREAFADSGAMHVLSVSGMHVAIIYSILFIFLGAPGSGNFTKRIFRFIAYGLAILLYVGLTGSCPAVVRAGIMIILYLLGKAMGWNTQVWNLLGFSAFMMMWLNPFVWGNIGFQLSYLAMVGILLYSKAMIRSITFKYKLLHMIWEVIVLSIVAQIFILPILLGQFHQFPLTFIISSLVAIPAGYLIVFGALLNVVLSFIGIQFGWIFLDWIGIAFIQSMKWMANLNPEMHFSLPFLTGVLLMAMAIFFTIAIVFRWPNGKIPAYACSFFALMALGCHRMKQWSDHELIIYHSYKGLITDVIANGRCISIHDCDVSQANIDFASRGFRCHEDIIDVKDICVEEEFEELNVNYRSSILSTPHSSILIWEGDENRYLCEAHFTHLIINQCPDLFYLTDILSIHPGAQIIIPAHVDRKLKKSILSYANDHQMIFCDIDSTGYTIIRI
ncbi:MAG: ComEC/Rec2 family competence protein [Saprospiraceae bacterium]